MTPDRDNKPSIVRRIRAVDPIFLLPIAVVLLAAGYLALSNRSVLPDQPAPTYPPGDPAALSLLKNMEAAMNTLTSLRAVQLLTDDAGHKLTTTMLYAAPDRVELITSTGEHSIVVSARQWTQDQGQTYWVQTKRSQPYSFPDFHDYGPSALNVQSAGTVIINGRNTRAVTFVLSTSSGPIHFEAFADPVTLRFLRVTMDAPDHHMITDYVDFAPGIPIEPPPLGLVATTTH